MNFRHDPSDPFFRDPVGSVITGTEVALRFSGECEGDVYLSVRRRFRDIDDVTVLRPAEAKETLYSFVLGPDLLSLPGVYYYELYSDGAGSGASGRITVTLPGLTVPEWFKNTVIYQIFPDRFAIGADSGIRMKADAYIYPSEKVLPSYIRAEGTDIARWDFYGGNLEGIRQKLSYIRSLGAGTVYLNPVFEAASNHRYDTADYEHIDGLLGGDGAFKRLTESMRDSGMRLILDGVFSHTGRNSRYFKAAIRGEKPFSDWYRFRDDGTYECWWGVSDLPCVNELDPDYLDYTVKSKNSIVRRWLSAGASGWRLDVADELPDEYIEELFKAATEEKPDAVIFGEVWEDGTDKVSYGLHRSYFTVPELHSQTNYPFRERLLSFFEGSVNAQTVSRAFYSDYLNYPSENYYSLVNMTGSHDVTRLFTCLKKITGNDVRLAKGLLKVYSLIQFCFPGVPLIYYGDEICMEGGTDPDNRRFFDWDSVSGSDTVLWFSSLSSLRKTESALRSGNIHFYDFGDNIFAFSRKDRSGQFVCIADRFGRGKSFILPILENELKGSYNIVIEADGYGLLIGLS